MKQDFLIIYNNSEWHMAELRKKLASGWRITSVAGAGYLSGGSSYSSGKSEWFVVLEKDDASL